MPSSACSTWRTRTEMPPIEAVAYRPACRSRHEPGQRRLAVAQDGDMTPRLPTLGEQRCSGGLRWLLGAFRCDVVTRPSSFSLRAGWSTPTQLFALPLRASTVGALTACCRVPPVAGDWRTRPTEKAPADDRQDGRARRGLPALEEPWPRCATSARQLRIMAVSNRSRSNLATVARRNRRSSSAGMTPGNHQSRQFFICRKAPKPNLTPGRQSCTIEPLRSSHATTPEPLSTDCSSCRKALASTSLWKARQSERLSESHRLTKTRKCTTSPPGRRSPDRQHALLGFRQPPEHGLPRCGATACGWKRQSASAVYRYRSRRYWQ